MNTPGHSSANGGASNGLNGGASSGGALIGFGQVWHQRLRPAGHAFRHRSYFLMLPLRRLRQQPDPALHRNARAALSFADADHGDGRADALAWFDELMAREQLGEDTRGEVWLQTYPRVLGHTFKPVSFWYAHDAQGRLSAVLAEVNNTFGDRHCYLLRGDALAQGGEVRAQKVFHVSPFCRVAGHYRFRFVLQRDAQGQPLRSLVRIDHHEGDGDGDADADAAPPLLQTSLGGGLEPLTPRSCRRALWGLPLMTLGVVLRIHWHALRLALKRVPFHRRPPVPDHFVSR